MLYAVVDIETTGGFASGNGITEISILVHDGSKVIESFETLINPEQEIPFYIESLTGISNDMVLNAPLFADVAPKIYEMLHDKVFVAHNVNFDFSFVRHQLAQSRFNLVSKKLCTVRMSRKIIPGHSSYSLGKLCQALRIPLNDRHRAGGDAAATALLLSLLLENDTEGLISQSLHKASKEQVLPANLSRSAIDALPSNPGVYYFKDNKGKIIYIGKAVNIKKRVCSHFSGNSIKKQRQEFLKNIHQIDFTICGTELMALILEAAEIQKYWPENNRALKRFEQKYALYTFEDQKGYMRLGIDKYKKNTNALFTFNSLLAGQSMLRGMITEHELCEKLCFIQKNRASCTAVDTGNCHGACQGLEHPYSYNTRVKAAVAHLKSTLPSFALIDSGRNEDEQSCLWVEEGKFYGMGYISFHTDVSDMESLKSCLEPYPSNDYILNMVLDYAEMNPGKKIMSLKEA
ncbi:exonuclease domain-containing protein [Pedobacter sp. MC2016-15]|uniref:exonuclease domain-containing protein n=1 Tax=Pedobacter sp. MC2016-15 TaxID=2994473 RepID=UPI002246DC95|nr:exonuclease domain-containing protein [Pedobacter sp. MC2016-15]MCX2478109.1 exonuclease domain-containing protein [Pedobacter sp. MC2016-15]